MNIPLLCFDLQFWGIDVYPSRSTSSYGTKKEHKCRRIIPFDSINILYVHHDIDKNKRKLALRLLSGFITGFQLCTRSTDTKCHEWSRRQADACRIGLYSSLGRTHHRARRRKEQITQPIKPMTLEWKHAHKTTEKNKCKIKPESKSQDN